MDEELVLNEVKESFSFTTAGVLRGVIPESNEKDPSLQFTPSEMTTILLPLRGIRMTNEAKLYEIAQLPVVGVDVELARFAGELMASAVSPSSIYKACHLLFQLAVPCFGPFFPNLGKEVMPPLGALVGAVVGGVIPTGGWQDVYRAR